ncbi:uncharacterized protein [Haliotis asinina]|uniref:uncharacterized protein n=1 Tax=Haliotis asinina TaxID=109174 RepID=UPI003531B197
MEMPPRQLAMVTLFLLSSLVTIFVSDAAETSTSCPEVGCFGRPVNVTCNMTGEYGSIGFSRPDAIEVVTCLKNKDECFINTQGYEVVFRSDEKHIMRIKGLNRSDVGTWNCRDLTNPLLDTCNIKGYDVRQSPTAARPLPKSDNCIYIQKTFRPQTLCKGFGEDPNVNITIKVAGKSYSFTYDQYKQDDEVELAYVPKGGELECSVTGPAAQCYTPTEKNTTQICSDDPPVPTWAIVVIVILIVIIIIGLLVDCFVCRPKGRGPSHCVLARLRSKNADVSTACSEKKTEGTTAETDSPPETNPLLDKKTSHVNSQMTGENETEKTKELEPEDKDEAATEPKSEDKDADTTGDKSEDKDMDGAGDKPADKGVNGMGKKSEDKGVDGTGNKSQDKGPAVLVVESENKQAT